MADSYIKILKEANGDITYPQTLASAVHTNSGSDIETEMGKYVTAEEIASTAEIDLSVLLSKLYPVGSIYMSATMSTTSQVEAALGGTWVAWGAGRVPVGVDTTQTEFDAAEETGGEKTHTLVNNELPKIEGTLPHTAYGETKVSGAFSFTTGSKSSYEGANTSTSNNRIYKLSFGNNAAHNNLQPYITCYMYKRTA